MLRKIWAGLEQKKMIIKVINFVEIYVENCS